VTPAQSPGDMLTPGSEISINVPILHTPTRTVVNFQDEDPSPTQNATIFYWNVCFTL
jgi:hypothetical protein